MRILIISQYFRPDITAPAFRIAETADLLAARGHEVTVVCARPHRGRAASEPAESGDYEVHRTAIAPMRGSGLFAHLLHYLSFLASASAKAVRLAAARRFDIVWVTSPPLFVGLAGVLVAKLRGIPMVLDVRDLWPESAVAAGQVFAGGRAFRIGKRLEAWLYSHAAAITCVSRPMAEHLRAASGKPVTTVYNGVLASGPVAPLTMERTDRRTLLYAGNLGRVQRLDLLIEAFCQVAAEPQLAGWHLHLIGEGVLAGALRRQAQANPAASRIHFSGALSKRETATRLAAADILFLNLADHEALEKTIPSKVFDYMAAGRPVVAGLSGEGAEILGLSGGNVVCRPSDGAGMAAALRAAMLNLAELEPKAAANRTFAYGRFSRETAVAELAAVFDAVLAPNAASITGDVPLAPAGQT